MARDPDAPLACFRCRDPNPNPNPKPNPNRNPNPNPNRCRQLEPAHDRQPLTSRTARLTRASGEALARAAGSDVSEGSGVWWRLATEVLPAQLRSAARIYERMPKESPTKLKLM